MGSPSVEQQAARDDVDEIELGLLLEAVYRRYGFDFREYAPASLRRRVWRRVHAEGFTTISALQDKLLHDPNCMERLLLDLSINVTAMFRDPSFYIAFRDNVVFAQHNLVSDRSFNEFNVILCRNVMIYFDRKLQQHVHELFYESLTTFGVLALGAKESIRFSPHEKAYEELDPSERLYRKVA